MNPTTTTWTCDTCGQQILTVGDGWVEWLTRKESDKFVGRGFRLVHHTGASSQKEGRRCQYDGNAEYRNDGSIINDLPLEQFTGPDGLMRLLSFIAEKELPTEEVLEMIKRIHIPGYEHARHHFKRAISDGAFEPNMPTGYYWQSDIAATLAWLKENRAE